MQASCKKAGRAELSRATHIAASLPSCRKSKETRLAPPWCSAQPQTHPVLLLLRPAQPNSCKAMESQTVPCSPGDSTQLVAHHHAQASPPVLPQGHQTSTHLPWCWSWCAHRSRCSGKAGGAQRPRCRDFMPWSTNDVMSQ